MNPKTTIVLVIALLLVVGGIWFAQPKTERLDQSNETGPQKLLDISADDITAYEIKPQDAAAYSFVKENEKWRMTAPAAGPAESFAVTGDIGKILGLQYEQTFEDKDRPSDEITSLDKPERIVKLTDKGGKSVVVKIGQRQQLSRKTYVQIEGDRKIYLVNGDVNADLRRKLSDYRGKRVAEFKIPEAVRIEVSGAENFTLAKSDQGWTIESPFKARADLLLVNKILSSVSNMTATQFVADEPKTLRPYGLENPRLVVRVTTEQKTPKPLPEIEGPTSQPIEPEYETRESVIAVAFGGAAESKVFARRIEPDSPAVFQVNETVMKDAGPAAADLRDKKIVSASTDRANQIRLSTGGQSATLVREGAAWKFSSEGEEAIAEFAAIDDVLKTLRDLKALGFEESMTPEMGLQSPRASLEVSVEGQTSPLKIAIGGETPSKTGVYIRNENEDFVAVVAKASADALAVNPVTFRSRTLLSFDLSQATRLEVVRGADTRVVEIGDGTSRMTAPIEGPAESANVMKILTNLSALRGRRVVATAADAASYGLTEAPVKVSVTLTPPAPTTSASEPADAPEPTSHTMLIARHGGLVYAMMEGGAVICEIDAKIATDLDLELFQTEVLSVEPSQVRSLAYAGENAFTFENQENTWKLKGESTFAVDAAKVTSVLDALRDLRAVRFVKYTGAAAADYGLDAPAVTITLTDEAGGSQGLAISPTGPSEGGRFASTTAQPDRVFVIKADDFTKLSKAVTDFQKAS